MAVAAVIFDLDGVLVDSEHAWEAARREVAIGAGGRWQDDAQARMMGMSTPEWTAWMRDELGVSLAPEEIFREVTTRLEGVYREALPLLPGAREAVASLAAHWPLGLASSSSRVLIDLVLELSGLAEHFAATVSSEEVARGKPAPDVYLRTAELLGTDPFECVATEDSTNGIHAAAAAGLRVIAIPDRDFPPTPEALDQATAVLDSLSELEPGVIERAGGPGGRRRAQRS